MHPSPEITTLPVSLRPIAEADMAFLRRLYASTRNDIQRAPLPQSQKDDFLAMQFEAQHVHYQKHFSDASFDVICLAEQPIGRIYVDVNQQEIRLIDIALEPEYRGQGIGEKLIRQWQQMASEKTLPLRLRVEPDNPAVRLYHRLGFRTIADEQTNLHLEWRAQTTSDHSKSTGE